MVHIHSLLKNVNNGQKITTILNSVSLGIPDKVQELPSYLVNEVCDEHREYTQTGPPTVTFLRGTLP